MLYRECRFRAAASIIREVNPLLSDGDIFQLLGGLRLQLCKMHVRSIPFYIVEGSCPKLAFDVFFDTFDILYDEINIDDLLDSFNPNDYFYVIPIANILLNNDKENNLVDKNMAMSLIGHSYALITSIDLERNRLILADESSNNNVGQWISLKLYKQVTEKVDSELYKIKIHRISKAEVRKNETLKKLMAMDKMSLVKDNLVDLLKDGVSELDNMSLKGAKIYDELLKHLITLLNLYRDNPNNSHIGKYIRMQIIYFRFFITSGTNTFYREEFLDSIKEVGNLTDDILLKEWHTICLKWRKLGRLLGILHIEFTETKYRELIDVFKYIREKETQLIEETIRIFSKETKLHCMK